MRTALLAIIFLLLWLVPLHTQVVWTEPAFPTQYDTVTIYFDAAQGNGALKGYAGNVYAHTGVITNRSAHANDWRHVIGNWGTDDARTKMTRVGLDTHTLKVHVNDFYRVPDGEVVEKLAFVFRDVTGNIVGRASDGADIFTPVYPPSDNLLITINAPNQEGQIVPMGDSILIDLQMNKRAFLSITDNGATIYQDSAEVLTFYHTPSSIGYHALTFKASLDDTLSVHSNYFVLDTSLSRLDPPPGIINGLNYTDSSYIFQLTAPNKSFCFLLCPVNAFEPDEEYLLHQSTTGDQFWIEIPRDSFTFDDGTYQYLIDDNIRVADPFSTIVLDPDHDPFIDPSVLKELPSYPTQYATGRVSAFLQHPSSFQWSDSNYQRVAQKDLVIYELLLRDFLDEHNFSTLADTLDYLQNLGVNAIELMPVSEFEGNISWGYNPSFHMAVDKYYGSQESLKKFINEAHKRGIAVIHDVVFNHAFSQSPLAQMWWDPIHFRPSSESPYLNVAPRHPFNVGYDFNHESKYTKDWVKQILGHWIEEFHFDGFRFDLSKGLTQTNSGNNAELMGRYDVSRISILKDYADHIWSLDSESYVIMEHFAENSEEIELSDYGMMLWGNMNHDFTSAAAGRRVNLAWADYKQRGWHEPNLIAYMESHDEERVMYNILRNGESDGDYDVRHLPTALQRIAAASTIYYLLPGPKMLWQFGEMGYDFSINHCENGTVDGCRLNRKPIRWDYLDDPHREQLYQEIRAILHLRNSFPVFSTDDYTFNDANLSVKSIELRHEDMDALVIANYRVTSSNVIPGFPYPGTWYEYFSGDSIIVDDLNRRIELAPGAYKVYTSVAISPPEDYTTNTIYRDPISISAYPNLIHPSQLVTVELSESANVQYVNITSICGQTFYPSYTQIGSQLDIRLEDLASGFYVLKIRNARSDYIAKIIVQGE